MSTSKEVVISTVKSVFGIIPYVGIALDQSIFEYRICHLKVIQSDKY